MEQVPGEVFATNDPSMEQVPVPGEVFGVARDDLALVRPRSKTGPATPPPLDEDFDVTLVSQVCGVCCVGA